MARIKDIRAGLGWSQSRMADFIGLSQSRVSHLESGQPESGVVSRLLDRLAQDIAEGRLVAEPASTPEASCTPEPATGET